GAYHVHLVQPVIDAVGESRPNQELFRELGVRLGVTPPSDDDLGETGALLDAAARLPEGVGAAVLGEGPLPTPGEGRPVMFVDVMPRTADQRVHLYPSEIDAPLGLYAYRPDPATDRHPLSLISPASEHTISSTLGELRP